MSMLNDKRTASQNDSLFYCFPVEKQIEDNEKKSFLLKILAELVKEELPNVERNTLIKTLIMSVVVKSETTNDQVGKKSESPFRDIKECDSINDIVNHIVTIGVWEMYTYEWLFNRKTFLYYHTMLSSYYFYDKNNNLTSFNDKTFFLYVHTFVNTEFVNNFIFKNEDKKKKIKLTSYTKTMQGRRKKQEDRYVVITDLSRYIDSNDYKTWFFYKMNPLYFFSIFDGHRGIKACEYCMTHIIKNIIYYLYNQATTDEAATSVEATAMVETAGGEITEEKCSDEKCETFQGESNAKPHIEEKTSENKKDDVSNVKNGNKSKEKRTNSVQDEGNNKKRKTYDTEEEVCGEDSSSQLKRDNDKCQQDVAGDYDKEDDDEGKANRSKSNGSGCNEDGKNEGSNKLNNRKKLRFLDDMKDEEIMECIKLAFLKTDEHFLKVSKFPNHGCTIISLIVVKNKMFIANLGDCRAIGIVNANNVLKTDLLSHDHKPNDPKEKERIKKMGGDVICLQNVYRVKANIKKIPSEKPSLLERLSLKEEVYLAVSRAIGDKDFKHNNVISALPDVICKEIYKEDVGGNEDETGIIKQKGEDPTVKSSKMDETDKIRKNDKTDEIDKIDSNGKTDEIDKIDSNGKTDETDGSGKNDKTEKIEKIDEIGEEHENNFKDSDNMYYTPEEINYHFVVMACDGVWDTLSTKDVTQILQTYQHDPDKACSEIIKTAYAYGSQVDLLKVVTYAARRQPNRHGAEVLLMPSHKDWSILLCTYLTSCILKTPFKLQDLKCESYLRPRVLRYRKVFLKNFKSCTKREKKAIIFPCKLLGETLLLKNHFILLGLFNRLERGRGKREQQSQLVFACVHFGIPKTRKVKMAQKGETECKKRRKYIWRIGKKCKKNGEAAQTHQLNQQSLFC
ncbi:protein phosphatase 2C, putative [Plasmodium ovale curtisi]|uniref:protein-serine/threonine phosphatase n=1 Tax=Plasmodium ovale curtisi TaxID=864141 RepID=A0A1A8WK78_PLAOA|nr:protein phosphatase 2C, putative [Plasmodium ovale curtisi]